MPKALRRPGGRWRLRGHEWVPGTGMYGLTHDVEPKPGADGEWRRHHELPAATEFDELVVGGWLHVEAMTATTWWMNVGGVTVHVTADREGRPMRVMVHGPGDYADPVPGCEYELDWSSGGE